jgi:hypothetical protein
MLKSFKLLILLFLFASYSQGQNLQLPNMPDSFEVKSHNLDSTQAKILFNSSLKDSFIINLNELVNFGVYNRKWNRLIDKPENTSTFRIGIDTAGFALNDGYWRYFTLKSNSVYYTGLHNPIPACNEIFYMTLYLDKPCMFLPTGNQSGNLINDISKIDYPIFRRTNSFSLCDSVKIEGMFYSEAIKGKNGIIIFEEDTIEVFCTQTSYKDSTIFYNSSNGNWIYDKSDQFLFHKFISFFPTKGSVIPILEYFEIPEVIILNYDKRLRTSTGINTITQPKLNLYPNPVKDVLNIEGIDNTEMLLFDAQGRMVWEGENVQQIQMQYLSEGIYHLSIKTDAGFLMKKIVKE